MRNGNASKVVLQRMASLRDQAGSGDFTLESLRGIEGTALPRFVSNTSKQC